MRFGDQFAHGPGAAKRRGRCNGTGRSCTPRSLTVATLPADAPDPRPPGHPSVHGARRRYVAQSVGAGRAPAGHGVLTFELRPPVPRANDRQQRTRSRGPVVGRRRPWSGRSRPPPVGSRGRRTATQLSTEDPLASTSGVGAGDDARVDVEQHACEYPTHAVTSWPTSRAGRRASARRGPLARRAHAGPSTTSVERRGQRRAGLHRRDQVDRPAGSPARVARRRRADRGEANVEAPSAPRSADALGAGGRRDHEPVERRRAAPGSGEVGATVARVPTAIERRSARRSHRALRAARRAGPVARGSTSTRLPASELARRAVTASRDADRRRRARPACNGEVVRRPVERSPIDRPHALVPGRRGTCAARRRPRARRPAANTPSRARRGRPARPRPHGASRRWSTCGRRRPRSASSPTRHSTATHPWPTAGHEIVERELLGDAIGESRICSAATAITIAPPVGDLRQPGVDVAAEFDELEVGPHLRELGTPPHRPAGHGGALRRAGRDGRRPARRTGRARALNAPIVKPVGRRSTEGPWPSARRCRRVPSSTARCTSLTNTP